MFAVVVSRADRASEHIGERLLDVADWTAREDPDRPDAEGGGSYYRYENVELRVFEELHIHLDRVTEAFSERPDRLAFASRHAGDTGPLLTAHHTGNFGPAEFGGTSGLLAEAAPQTHKRFIRAFERHAPDDYEVAMESTHHGPSEVGCPSLFVELGSDDEQWDDPEGAEAVARAILDCRTPESPANGDATAGKRLVGFGGGHYAPTFERVVRETDWAVGHLAADWCLDDMGHPREHRDVVEQAFERSSADYALVEGERPVLREVVAELGHRVVSETWLRETSGVPLAAVEALEDALCEVDDGLRFGEAAVDFDGAFDVVELSSDLTEEATNVDPEAALQAVAARTVAFETEESGTRPAGRVALAGDAARDGVVRALAEVLEAKYDSVDVREDCVVAREEAFDPSKAATLGVPEGPAFGKLASGHAVEVDGRRIPPEQVRTAREVTFAR